MTAPKLSVVMATYNRAETLQETLRHLDEQTLPPHDYEVIIVDDGSTDQTIAVVEACRKWVRFSLEFMTHPNRGPGFTQNRGIRLARAPITLLMADDILMSPGALAAHLAMHEEHPEPEAAALGCVLQSPRLNHSLFLRKWDPFRFRDLKNLSELPYYLFWACNISFKTNFMRECGMFREQAGRAGPAAHEDVEVGYRLSRQGLRIFYAKQALGHHFHVETLDGALQRAFQRGLNWDEFRDLVPEPELALRYGVLSLDTLGDHVRVLTGPRRGLLYGPDRNPLRIAIQYFVRFIGFNGLLVNLFWVPLLRAAERSAVLARFVSPKFYRLVISRNFVNGRRRGVQLYGRSRSTRERWN